MDEKPDENPYEAPQSKLPDSAAMRQPHVSLTVLFCIPITLWAVMGLIASVDNPREAYPITALAIVWLGAVAWLIRRIVRRHRKASPHS